MKNKIDNFSNEFRFLSNFYHSPFMFNDKWYITNEHFYQACKTTNDEEHERVRRCKHPGQAKRMGSKVGIRPEWDHVKTYVMKVGLRLKFSYNVDLRQRLVDTGDIHLEEGNLWHDNFWGNCTCKKCNKKEGRNVLGNMLMNYRELLKMDRWDKDQAFDVLDAIKMTGVYPTMLSAVDYIMNDFNINRDEAKQVLYE